VSASQKITSDWKIFLPDSTSLLKFRNFEIRGGSNLGSVFPLASNNKPGPRKIFSTQTLRQRRETKHSLAMRNDSRAGNEIEKPTTSATYQDRNIQYFNSTSGFQSKMTNGFLKSHPSAAGSQR
jgi:hypothetical protein